MPHPCGAIAPTTVCGFFGRYNAPFPFGLRHADGSPMTKAETVRRLVKLQVPMFTIPRSRITAPGTSQAVGSGSRKQAHWRCLTPPHTHYQACTFFAELRSPSASSARAQVPLRSRQGGEGERVGIRVLLFRPVDYAPPSFTPSPHGYSLLCVCRVHTNLPTLCVVLGACRGRPQAPQDVNGIHGAALGACPRRRTVSRPRPGHSHCEAVEPQGKLPSCRPRHRSRGAAAWAPTSLQ